MAKSKMSGGVPGRTGKGGGRAEVGGAESHKPVSGKDRRGDSRKPPSFGAEFLIADGGEDAPKDLSWWTDKERTAIPAGVLSYGDSLDSAIERLRARMIETVGFIKPDRNGLVPESIFGVDTRRPVDASVYPCSALCYLVTRFPGLTDQVALGTGWIVGRRTIITAGHCVYINGSNIPVPPDFADEILVFPAQNSINDRPYGPFIAQTGNLRTTSGWRNQHDPTADYGAIVLSDDLPEELGAFGFDSNLDPSVRKDGFHITGYPGEFKDGRRGTLWDDTGTVRPQGPQLFYRIDTSPGQSGAPVYYINKSDDPDQQYAVAVGIHNYGLQDPNDPKRFKFPEGQPGSNNATYIIGSVFTNLTSWKAEGD